MSVELQSILTGGEGGGGEERADGRGSGRREEVERDSPEFCREDFRGNQTDSVPGEDIDTSEYAGDDNTLRTSRHKPDKEYADTGQYHTHSCKALNYMVNIILTAARH